MKWSENYIRNIVADLAEENVFACRALLKVSEIVFTDKVRTLAVSLSSSPVLMINRKFLDENAVTENDIKAVLIHEFLHVILNHTEKFKYNTPLLNIALDAIINSIIHRTYGSVYSDFFCRMYKWEGVESLLRPLAECKYDYSDDLTIIHRDIYAGKYAADDLYELLRYMLRKGLVKGLVQMIFIGNHESDQRVISADNRKLLDEIMGKMDGTGIWNKPGRGISEKLNFEQKNIEKLKIKKWRTSTIKILKKCMSEDLTRKNLNSEHAVFLPILSSNDRRSLTTYSWSGLIPISENKISLKKTAETVNIYLDVSGSMSEEINQLVSLLYQFRKQIRNPIWVFSNEVEKAAFKDGKLEYYSTGGTSISCVFDHIRENRFSKNIIVTDGFVERITTEMIAKTDLTKLWVIVSANGNPNEFEQLNIKYHQLKKY